MPHPTIDKCDGFEQEPLFLCDEDGTSLLVLVITSTWSICGNGDLMPAKEQHRINVAGVPYCPGPQFSYKYEPQTAFTKPSTDVVLIGHAQSPGSRVAELIVRFRLGPLSKSIRVTGDRYWVKSLGMLSITSPEPFEEIPLVYERAFGGWDRSCPDPARHTFEPRNPVGTGFRAKHGSFEEGIRLPNLEDPHEVLQDYGQAVRPAGFGFISPNWQPRLGFAGTYDEQWQRDRMPLLPKDFDRRFFNAASPGLVAPAYLKGDEAVSVENASPRGTISFHLPRVRPPECRIQLTGGRNALAKTNLDTVIVNTDDDLLILLWRGYVLVRNGPQDVVSIQIQAEGASAPVVAR